MTTCNLVRHGDRRFCCARCQRVFSAMEVFDWHRRDSVCTDPAEGGFITRTIPGKVGTVDVWGLNKTFDPQIMARIRAMA